MVNFTSPQLSSSTRSQVRFFVLPAAFVRLANSRPFAEKRIAQIELPALRYSAKDFGKCPG
ncbi:MAG: hypothetical protein WB760_28185 [Xanthobacteraceae bacterium]